MKVSAVSVALCLSAFVSTAEDLVLSGDSRFDVASGTTETISAKVTGSGRIVLAGGGTLVLNNSANDFTGGIIVSNGIVRADASGVFGTGPITLEGTEAVRSVQLNSQNGSFTNTITLKDYGTSYSYPAIHALKYAKLQGKVSADKSVTANTTDAQYFYIKLGTSDADKDVDLLKVENEMDIGSTMLYTVGWGKAALSGKVRVTGFYLGYNHMDCGTVSLYDSQNEIGTISLRSFDIDCRNNNVMQGASISFAYDQEWYINRRCIVYLNGFDQELSHIITSVNFTNGRPFNWKPDEFGVGFANYNQDSTSVLTFNSSRAGEKGIYADACVRFFGGSISIRIEKNHPYDFYQRFLFRNNPTTGDFSVSGGNLEFKKDVVFPSMTNLTVTGGAVHFNVATNSLPALKKISVSNGKLVCLGSNRDAFGEGTADLYLGEGALLDFRDGATNTVRKLFVGGEYMPAGVYTKDNLPAMSSFTGTGALVVRRGRAGMMMLLK